MAEEPRTGQTPSSNQSPASPPSPPLSDTLEIVAVASQAQAGKVREILQRAEVIANMEPQRLRNIAELMSAAAADGGCGIGCW